jgi:hypothetical protein
LTAAKEKAAAQKKSDAPWSRWTISAPDPSDFSSVTPLAA